MYTWIWCAAGSIFLTLLPALPCAGRMDNEELKIRWLLNPPFLHGMVPFPASAFSSPILIICYLAAFGVMAIGAIFYFCCRIYLCSDTQKPRLPRRATDSSRSKYSELVPLIPTAKKQKVAQKPLPYTLQNCYQSEAAPYPQVSLFVHKEMAPSRKTSTLSMPQPPTAPMKPSPPYQYPAH